MLATFLIVFREVIEAGLIVGIVLAATRGVAGRGLWISYGIIGGLAGAGLVAVFAGELAALSRGRPRTFQRRDLIIAVAMLTWHNVWMASHGRAMAQQTREVGLSVARGQEPLAALATVCGLAVLREGSEVVLFLYGIAATGGSSSAGMMAGGALRRSSGCRPISPDVSGVAGHPHAASVRRHLRPYNGARCRTCGPGRPIPAASWLHRRTHRRRLGHLMANL